MTRPAVLLDHIRAADWVRRTGRITRFVGVTVESMGPDAKVGELCEIYSRTSASSTYAEVVGFSKGRVQLMPYQELIGIEVGSEVIATGRSADAMVSDQLLGRVLDGFGVPLDDGPALAEGTRVPLYPNPINPLRRGAVVEPVSTGIRAIDALLPLGRGQRMGVFAGSGVGKSTLLGMLARGIDSGR